jgi:hypothetical protein
MSGPGSLARIRTCGSSLADAISSMMAGVVIKNARLTGSEPGRRAETVTPWFAGSGVRQHRHECRHNFHVWSLLSWGWREVSRRATGSMGLSSWISNPRSSQGRKYQFRSMNIPERGRLRQGVRRARWHPHVDSGQRRSRLLAHPGTYGDSYPNADVSPVRRDQGCRSH